MNIPIQTNENIESKLAQHDTSILDLVFVMDCTGSMSSYINSATKNIQFIVKEIVATEQSDIHLALIEYRDHPPQESTFVTRVHDFTNRVDEMKQWLEQCQASGGGDIPEAVADALQGVLTLSWRSEATKICILISDAPPHGLDSSNDSFPNGCPLGLDPIRIVREMAENKSTLYTVGVEPLIIPYRDFFMSLAYITGGQYVPLDNAYLLTQVIIAGVREEISLDRLMNNAQQDIIHEIQQAEKNEIDERETAMRINQIFASKNIRVKQMRNTQGATSKIVEECYSKCINMHEMQSKYKRSTVKSNDKRKETDYTLKEDNVTLEQAKRLIQKVKNRRLVKSNHTEAKDDKTIPEKRLKDNSIDMLPTTEDQCIQDQDVTEKQSKKMKIRRRKQTNSTDIDVPKQKVTRRSKKILHEISNDPTPIQQIQHIEQVNSLVHQNTQLHNMNIYLILFFVMALAIVIFLCCLHVH